MSNESQAFDIFEANIDAGQDIIIVKMIEGGVSAGESMKLYTKFAREAGLIVSPAVRKKAAMELLDSKDVSTVEGYDEALAELVTANADVSKATLKRYIKDFAKDNGIELPKVQLYNKLSAALEAISKEDVEDKSRKDVISVLTSEAVGYTENTAAGAYNKVRKHYGFEKAEAKSGQLTAWFIENPAATNEEILAKGAEIGLAETSVRYYIGMYNLSLEVARAIND